MQSLTSAIVVSFQCSDTVVLVGRKEGHSACKSWALVSWWLRFDSSCHLHLSPSPLAPIKSTIETFWYQLIQVHLENCRRNGERERERERVVELYGAWLLRVNEQPWFSHKVTGWAYIVNGVQNALCAIMNMIIRLTWTSQWISCVIADNPVQVAEHCTKRQHNVKCRHLQNYI